MNATLDPTDGAWVYRGGMRIDADGSPRAYGPHNRGLELNANGGPIEKPYGYLLNPATGKPFVQGEDAPEFSAETRGMWVSATTYERTDYAVNDPMRYLNSENERYIVVPARFRRTVPGIVLGCRARVMFEGKECEALVGDLGPDFGEASIAVAKALGIDANPRSGGVERGVEYRIYPGVRFPGYRLIST